MMLCAVCASPVMKRKFIIDDNSVSELPTKMSCDQVQEQLRDHVFVEAQQSIFTMGENSKTGCSKRPEHNYKRNA